MPFKRLIFFIIGLTTLLNVAAQQQTADIGLLGAGTIPISDYSHTKLFQSINPALGIFYRHNFNSRIALRINAMYGNVGATGYLNNKDNKLKFKKTVFDISSIIEVNYLDFILGVKQMKFSPYVFTGFGLSFYQGTNGASVITGNIPIGLGVKYALTKTLGIGAEYSMHKLMNDELDNLNNPYNIIESNDIFHNNDWVNYFGLTLTYKFYWGKKPCPAYNSLYD
ncbi:MAG TPA: DUF6089 family protein [Prolixibacteraceae bacterium]|nr:DUF6089 family protein [Prolixibacteraceae bacterium]